MLGSRGPITYFGAMNLLTEEPAMAGGRTVLDSVLVMIPGDEFRRLLRDEPSVMHGALRVIAPTFQGAAGRPARAREADRAGHALRRAGARAQQPRRGRPAQRRRAGEGVPGPPRGGPRVRVERGRARPGRDPGGAPAGGARPGGGRGGARGRPARLRRPRGGARRRARRGGARRMAAGPAAGRGRPRSGVARPAARRRPARPSGSRAEWIVASLSARGLAQELHESTARISEIVGAVKEYTYMDQAQTSSPSTCTTASRAPSRSSPTS